MAFADRDLEYLDAVHPPAGAVLKAMQAQGRAEKIPIVNAATGWLLRIQVAAVQPNRVVEVGTAIGFSTLWMATALPAGGRILTIDPDRSRTARAQAFWRQAGVEERIEVISEPALTALPRLEAGIGFAFIDALKTEYLGYLDLLVPRMAPGGMIAADNLLWSGRIAAGNTDPDTAALRAFNQRFLHHERLDATILPVGDGVGIGVVRSKAAA